MPHVVAALVAGAAFYAGMKWLAQMIEVQRAATERMAEELKRAAERKQKSTPKDMGVLEFDEATGSYRAKGPEA
jgi:hypothetical protein